MLKQVLLSLGLFLNIHLASASEVNSVSAQSKLLLAKYDALPHLLDLAIAEERATRTDRYEIQRHLAAQYQIQHRPYVVSMPYRHRYTCSTGEHTQGEAKHEIYNPTAVKTERLDIWEHEIHEIRMHGAAFTPAQREFLMRLPPAQ